MTFSELFYGDDAPRIDLGLITLIPESEREAFLASLMDDDDGNNEGDE
jgi:hypothetical protein